jgi:hypothetical protein
MNINVKPKPIVYFAGKVSSRDWRTKIIGGLRGEIVAGNDEWKTILDPGLTIDQGTFLYGGPFFIACGHGCAHGAATHGASAGGCLTGQAHLGKLELREAIWDVNHARIRRADLIFAYINEVDCFGTFLELGKAFGMGKAIGIGIGRQITIEQFEDLWMVRMCHHNMFSDGEMHRWCSGDVYLGTPEETFNQFFTDHVEWWGFYRDVAEAYTR